MSIVNEWVDLLLGLAAVAAILIGIGKGWAAIQSSERKGDAVHRRLDRFQSDLEDLKLDVREIKTEVRLRTTLRFKIPETGDQA